MERTAESRQLAGHGRPRSEPGQVVVGEGPVRSTRWRAIFAFSPGQDTWLPSIRRGQDAGRRLPGDAGGSPEGGIRLGTGGHRRRTWLRGRFSPPAR